MAVTTVLLPNQQWFPVGTTCKVFVENERILLGPGQKGRPVGTPVAEPAVAAGGTLTVEGLVAGVQYVVWAALNGVDRYVRFMAAPVSKHRRLPASP